jgi:predicted enzyme related to lactoylglutathione lyase
VVRTHGGNDWFELQVPDVDKAKSFYGELFGWVFVESDVGGVRYAMFKVDGDYIGGVWCPPTDDIVAPHWENYVTVSDVDKVAASATELGGKVVVPPTDVEGVGRFCTIMDSQGAVISAMTYFDDQGELDLDDFPEG